MCTEEALKKFLGALKGRNGLRDLRYCGNMNIKTAKSRVDLGLPPTSPIYPLKGNKLSRTKVTVPGIHSPYAYEGVAVFALYREDWDLYSANYLHLGQKFWIVAKPEYATDLENKCVRDDRRCSTAKCAQFLRHAPTFIPPEILDDWGISYKTIHQRSNEVIITFLKAYH